MRFFIYGIAAEDSRHLFVVQTTHASAIGPVLATLAWTMD